MEKSFCLKDKKLKAEWKSIRISLRGEKARLRFNAFIQTIGKPPTSQEVKKAKKEIKIPTICLIVLSGIQSYKKISPYYPERIKQIQR